MRHRGQVSSFIIIGLLLVVIISIGYYLLNQKEISFQGVISSTSPASALTTFVEHCLHSVTIDGLQYLGFQGGYYVPSPPFFEQGSVRIPFYIYLNESYPPQQETFSQGLSYYIRRALPLCMANTTQTTPFTEMGYTLTQGNLTVISSLGPSSVEVHVEFPLTLTKEGTTVYVSSFQTTLPFRSDRIFAVIHELITAHQTNPTYTPLGLLSELAVQQQFTYDLVYPVEDTVLYVLAFNETPTFPEPYLFTFAAKYPWRQHE